MPSRIPAINSVKPSSVAMTGGVEVVITGQNFAQGCKVKFGHAAARVVSASPKLLKVMAPPVKSAGAVNVRVENPDGQTAVARDALNYKQEPSAARLVTGARLPPSPVPVIQPTPIVPAPVLTLAPVITNVSPSSGPVSGGTQVRIDGQNFAPNCQVNFNNTSAQVFTNTPSLLAVVTPPSALAGPASVSVVNPGMQPVFAPTPFQYLAVQPSILPLEVTVFTPAGGETLRVGQSFDITWTSRGASSQRVQFSTDGGLNFTPIVTGLAGNVGLYTWVVPPLVPAGSTEVQALVRVVARSADGRESSGLSGPFTVQPAAPAASTVIKSITPAGARQLKSIAAGQSVSFEDGFEVRQGENGPLVSTCVGISLSPGTVLPPGASAVLSPKRSASPPCGTNQILTCGEGGGNDCGRYILTVNTTVSGDPSRNTPPGDYTVGVDGFCGVCVGPQTLTESFTFRVEKPQLTLSAQPSAVTIFAGEKAQFRINAQRSFYAGPIRISSEFTQPLPPNSATALPLDFPMNLRNTNATESGVFEIQTFESREDGTSGTPPGTYTLKVRANDGGGFPPVPSNALELKLEVKIRPDVSINILQPNEMTAAPGDRPVEVEYKGALRRNNFTGDVVLSVEGEPQGVTHEFTLEDTKEVSPGVTRTKFTLALTVQPNVAAGTYPLKATATFMAPDNQGVLQQQVRKDKFSLVVKRKQGGAGFQLSVTPSSQEVFQGASIFYQVGVTKFGGFKNKVRLSVASSPPLNPPPMFSGNADVVMSAQFSANTSRDTAPGQYALTVTGQALDNNGQPDENIAPVEAGATLVVKQRTGTLTITLSQSQVEVMPGGEARLTATVERNGSTEPLSFGFDEVSPGLLMPRLGTRSGDTFEIIIAAPLNIRPGQGFVTLFFSADDAGSARATITVIILQPQTKGAEGKDKDVKERKEGKEGKERKEGKELKEKDGKESKEDKEVKEKDEDKGKERKEGKDVKERFEGKGIKEDFEGGFSGGDIGPVKPPRVGRPATPEETPEGRSFINPEQRPRVGRRALEDPEERRRAKEENSLDEEERG